MSSRSSRESTNDQGISSSTHEVSNCSRVFSSMNGIPKTTGNAKGKTEDEECLQDELEQKRQKNREAAKRCRTKKVQVTEELKKKVEELQYDNRKLAEERGKLIKKCKRYKREIEEHKQKGCSVTQFMCKLLEGSMQDSHSDDDSGSSSVSLSSDDTSSPEPTVCPSSTSGSSFSPFAAACASKSQSSEHVTASAGSVSGSKGVSSSQSNFSGPDDSQHSRTMKPVSSITEQLQYENLGLKDDVHYITVRTRDGSIKHLAVRRAQYMELMNQMAANKQSQQQRAEASREVVITRQATQNSARTLLTNSSAPHPPILPDVVFQQQHQGTIEQTANTARAAVLGDGESTNMIDIWLLSGDLIATEHQTEGRLNIVDNEVDTRSDYTREFIQIQQLAEFLEQDSQQSDLSFY